MPIKLKDSEGKEVEVPTQEEINALVDKGKKEVEDKYKDYDELKKGLGEKDKKLSDLQSDLETAQEALDKSGKGTQDWAEARKTIKGLEGKIDALTKERETDQKKFTEDIRNVRTSLFSGQVSSWMDTLAGDNKELREKIDFHYKRVGGEGATDEKQAQELMKDAYLLSTGKQAPNMFNVARATGGDAPKTNEPTSQEVSDMGKKFGLSDDDIKKYGGVAQDKKQGAPNQ